MKAMKAMKAAADMNTMKAKAAVAMKAGPIEKAETRKVAMAKKNEEAAYAWTQADKKRQKQQAYNKCRVKGGLSARRRDRTSGAGQEKSRGPRLHRPHRATEKAGLMLSQLREAYLSGYTAGAEECYQSLGLDPLGGFWCDSTHLLSVWEATGQAERLVALRGGTVRGWQRQADSSHVM